MAGPDIVYDEEPSCAHEHVDPYADGYDLTSGVVYWADYRCGHRRQIVWGHTGLVEADVWIRTTPPRRPLIRSPRFSGRPPTAS